MRRLVSYIMVISLVVISTGCGKKKMNWKTLIAKIKGVAEKTAKSEGAKLVEQQKTELQKTGKKKAEALKKKFK